MFKVIKWGATLRVANERKVAKIVERYATAIGQRMTLLGCERFRENRSLFLVEFASPLYVENISEAIFVTLCICNKMHLGWNITGPFSYDGGLWEFRGYAANHAEGIENIAFSIDNFADLEATGQIP